MENGKLLIFSKIYKRFMQFWEKSEIISKFFEVLCCNSYQQMLFKYGEVLKSILKVDFSAVHLIMNCQSFYH